MMITFFLDMIYLLLVFEYLLLIFA